MNSLNDIKVHTGQKVGLPKVSQTEIDGVTVYTIEGNSEPVMHLELIFGAGRIHAADAMVPVATASMLNEGTTTRSSKEIAEGIEYYGSTLRASAGTDALSVSLYCMTKYFAESLEVVQDVLVNSTFPTTELELYKQNRAQRLDISNRKNEYIANKALSKEMYGDHPYGYSVTKADILALNREALLQHYALLRKDNLTIFISGDVRPEHLETIGQLIRNIGSGTKTAPCEPPKSYSPELVTIDGPQHLQCAIRAGKQVITRNHEDFPGLYFLNTLFGGYFGSRLMKNIREEKGLTYGISTSLETLAEAACLILSTEASLSNKDIVMTEIQKEVQALQTTRVELDEVNMVRNYIKGSLMMQLDGAFRAMDVVKTLIMESGSIDGFQAFVSGIDAVDADSITNLANKYLSWEDFHKVIVV